MARRSTSAAIPRNDDVILSAKPRAFDRFFAALAEGKAPDDSLALAEREQGARERDLFAEWDA